MKVNFVYSWIYDEVFKELYNLRVLGKENGLYPEAAEIEEYIKGVEPLWQSKEMKILDKFSEITTLDWQDEKIDCYVVGWVVPYSHPLTVPMYKNQLDYFTDMLAHELIHVLLIQNLNTLGKYWIHLDEKYPDLTPGAKNHIPLHAILKKAYLELGYESQLKIHRDSLAFIDDYSISWKIVDEEGYQEIIDEMISYKGK